MLDASAVAAICLGEPGAELLVDALADRSDIMMSAGTFIETAIVLDRRSPGVFDRVMASLEVRVVSVDAEQAEIARQAYTRFGKGTGHPAQLNFGDCFSYALAKVSGAPVLFRGSDFSHTDVPCWNPAD